MVTSWRRAFCTSIPKDKQVPKTEKQCDDDSNNITPTSSTSNIGLFSSNSNPSTPRLQSQPVSSPSLRCRTTPNSPKLQCHATPVSSPSSFSRLKLRLLSKTKRCGICLESVKAGEGRAIFTAECSHCFHFPCISSRQQLPCCPVCNTQWKQLPVLSLHHHSTNNTIITSSKNLRVYDDDEPLLSPTSSASRFNPIPEEEPDNHAAQPSLVLLPPRFLNRTFFDVRLMPEAAIVASGRGYDTYAVVMKVKLSSVLVKRAPVDLVAVVDVGGAKIQAARTAMRAVVSSLGSSDRLSIVAFSSASKRLLPLRRMTAVGRRSAQRISDAMISVAAAGQGISVGDAVKKAVKVLEDRREKSPLGTIVLLSNDGSYRRDVSSTRFSVHAVGLDGFDAKRVASLLRVAARDVELKLGLGSGSGEITAVYSLSTRPGCVGSGSVRLGDFHVEEERELLVEIKVPTCSSGPHHVLSVRSNHRDPSSTEVFQSREQPILVPPPQSVRSSPTIQRLRDLHVATRAVAESRRLADRADFVAADRLLTSARVLLSQSRSASAGEFVRGLEAELNELYRLKNHHFRLRADEKPEVLTPTSAWRAAERLAKVAIMRKSMNRVSDLHGFENARF